MQARINCVPRTNPERDRRGRLHRHHTSRKTDLIEGVLSRATKLVPGLKDIDYSERLEYVDACLPSTSQGEARLTRDIQVYAWPVRTAALTTVEN